MTWKRTVIAGAVIVSLAGATALAEQTDTKRIPQRLHWQSGDPDPSWISLSSLYEPTSGKVDLSALPSAARGRVEHYIKRYAALTAETGTPTDGSCAFASMEPVIDWADRGDTSSLQSLTRASKAIVTGQVIDTDVGFFNGFPGTLLRVRIDKRIKQTPAIDASEDLFVYFAGAQFDLGPTRFCNKPLAGTETPVRGDTVMVFVQVAPRVGTTRVVYGESRDILIERGKKIQAVRPIEHELRENGLRTLAEVAAKTRTLITPSPISEMEVKR